MKYVSSKTSLFDIMLVCESQIEPKLAELKSTFFGGFRAGSWGYTSSRLIEIGHTTTSPRGSLFL